MPEPRPRSPAQIEASRRNGARSNGPVTPEGKARASRNALKHGLTAMHHLVLEDEVPDELEELTFRMIAETGAVSEIEARLARRLAIAFWKGERAERIEVALFDAAPSSARRNGFQRGGRPADHLRRQALQRDPRLPGPEGREISRCLKELRLLRKDALAEGTDEPEAAGSSEISRTNCRPARRTRPVRKSNLGASCETNPGTYLRPPTTMRQARPRLRPQIGAQAPRNKPEPAAAPSIRPGRRARARRTGAPFQPPAAAGVGGDAAAGPAARSLTARREQVTCAGSEPPQTQKPRALPSGARGVAAGPDRPVRRQVGDRLAYAAIAFSSSTFALTR